MLVVCEPCTLLPVQMHLAAADHSCRLSATKRGVANCIGHGAAVCKDDTVAREQRASIQPFYRKLALRCDENRNRLLGPASVHFISYTNVCWTLCHDRKTFMPDAKQR